MAAAGTGSTSVVVPAAVGGSGAAAGSAAASAASSAAGGAGTGAASGSGGAAGGGSTGATGGGVVPVEKRRKEIYTFEAAWPLFGLGCSQRAGAESGFRFAVGSFVEEYCNKVQIIQLDDEKAEFVVRSTFDHPYPTTKIMWAPEKLSREKDLLATTGDYLRLWTIGPSGEPKLDCILNNVRWRWAFGTCVCWCATLASSS